MNPGTPGTPGCDAVSALAAAGLRLEFLHEHDSGHVRFPAGRRVPQIYSLRAAKAGRAGPDGAAPVRGWSGGRPGRGPNRWSRS
jgi:hypothetical protein